METRRVVACLTLLRVAIPGAPHQARRRVTQARAALQAPVPVGLFRVEVRAVPLSGVEEPLFPALAALSLLEAVAKQQPELAVRAALVP